MDAGAPRDADPPLKDIETAIESQKVEARAVLRQAVNRNGRGFDAAVGESAQPRRRPTLLRFSHAHRGQSPRIRARFPAKV